MKDVKECRPKRPKRLKRLKTLGLVSFYAAREDGYVGNEPVHHEKFCVPVSGKQNFSKGVIKT